MLDHVKPHRPRQQSGAPASVEQRHAKGAQAAKLRVALLAVAHGAHELLHRDGLLVLEAVLLRRQPAAVYQYVGVRCAAPHMRQIVRLLSWCLRKRATAALMEAHTSEQWHRHLHKYAASFMAGDFACMTCLTAAHEILSTCAGCTCDASHCARHMVIQLVHFLSPHAHRVCVQQLHQNAELLETARSITVRELHRVSHKESVSEHRLCPVSDKTASVHSTLSKKSVVLHTEYSVLYSTQSTVVV